MSEQPPTLTLLMALETTSGDGLATDHDNAIISLNREDVEALLERADRVADWHETDNKLWDSVFRDARVRAVRKPEPDDGPFEQLTVPVSYRDGFVAWPGHVPTDFERARVELEKQVVCTHTGDVTNTGDVEVAWEFEAKYGDVAFRTVRLNREDLRALRDRLALHEMSWEELEDRLDELEGERPDLYQQFVRDNMLLLRYGEKPYAAEERVLVEALQSGDQELWQMALRRVGEEDCELDPSDLPEARA